MSVPNISILSKKFCVSLANICVSTLDMLLIKTAYFNYAYISASFKKFHQKLHLLVFVIIKSAMLFQFTNPSKWSTFNVRLVADKNFRTIAPTGFPIGVSKNWFKILSTIPHIFINVTANRTKFCGDVGYR